jgi:hypothetical protein
MDGVDFEVGRTRFEIFLKPCLAHVQMRLTQPMDFVLGIGSAQIVAATAASRTAQIWCHLHPGRHRPRSELLCRRRSRRLLRTRANKLSAKMTLPPGLFIFPVVLLVVMLPVVIN